MAAFGVGMENKILIILLILGLIYFSFNYKNWVQFWEVDKCLDAGGRWNYENNYCEKS